LKRHGFRRQDEVALIDNGFGQGDTDAIVLEPVIDDAGWARKRTLQEACATGPDGHPMAAAAWVELERRKVAAGGMTPFLIVEGGQDLGMVATMDFGSLLRLKNLVVHTRFRGAGVTTRAVRAILAQAHADGRDAVGCFALAEGGRRTPLPGLRVPRGGPAVRVDVEWQRNRGVARRPLGPATRAVMGTETMTERAATGLSPDDLHTYRSKGFVVVRGVLGAEEIDALREECGRLWDRDDIFADGNLRVERRSAVTGGTVRDRLDPVVDISPPLRRLTEDDRILAIARDAIGCDARLFKDKLIFKRPGTMGYGAHQEFGYWEDLGYPGDAFVNIQVCIDDSSAESGPVEFVAGFHDRRLPGPPEEPRDVDETLFDPGQWEPAVARAGDVVTFHALTPHRSGPNVSDGRRAALFLTYIDARFEGAYEALYDYRLGLLKAAAGGKHRPFFR